MRRISLILLSIGALLALSFYWQGSVVAQDAQREVVGRTDLPGESPEDWGNWFFGQRVAGVSLSWWFVDELGGLPVDPIWGHSTVTLNADGTASLSDTSDFNGHPVFAGFNTPIHAVWERIGCRTIRLKHLVFNFAGAAGPWEPPAGALESISINTAVAEFNNDFTEYVGTWEGTVYPPEALLGPDLQQPLTTPNNPDPAFPPIITFAGEFGGAVLEVTP